MPDESTWEGFFLPEQVLVRLGLASNCRNVVDFGCGYGMFSIAAARMISGRVRALDIDSSMVIRTQERACELGLTNVDAIRRDFIENGTGVPDGFADYVMLFNILHAEEPKRLIEESHRILAPGGRLAVIHWNVDPSTPRGPSTEIRPTPEQCRSWAESAAFRLLAPGTVALPPYHYGLVFEKPLA